MTKRYISYHFGQLLVIAAILWLTVACGAPPTPTATSLPTESRLTTIGSCLLALPADTTDEGAIAAVLQAEGEFVVQQEIDRLMLLWQEGGTVVDAKHTATDESDDQQWLDKDAIRHRYVRTVFPGAPAVATPKDLAIRVDGSQATVTSTTQIGNEISPGGDRWQLSKEGDCWMIYRLTYNLESQ